MRNLFSAVVNWIAALFAAGSGAPHPIVATDVVDGTDEPDERPQTRPRL